jgi:hypothetical protein
VTVALLLAGCGGGASQPSQSPLPVELPETEPEVQMLELFFSSGAGAWSTEITLQPDGSFTGFYSDADMGSSGEGYPNGTVYLCGFEGEFSEKVPRDEYSWSMTLESLTHDYEEGKDAYYVTLADGKRRRFNRYENKSGLHLRINGRDYQSIKEMLIAENAKILSEKE